MPMFFKHISFIISFSTAYPMQRHRGAGAYDSIVGQRQATPWTSHQVNKGMTYRDIQPFRTTGNFWTMGGSQREPIYLVGTA